GGRCAERIAGCGEVAAGNAGYGHDDSLTAEGQGFLHQGLRRVHDLDVGLIGARGGDHVHHLVHDLHVGHADVAFCISHGVPGVIDALGRRRVGRDLAHAHAPGAVRATRDEVRLEYDLAGAV